MPRVLNKHRDIIPPDAVYVGRPSPFGNPYTDRPVGHTLAHLQVRDRAEAIAKFREYLMGNRKLLALVRKELRGKDLVCFCAPKACHGDVLLEIANAPQETK